MRKPGALPSVRPVTIGEVEIQARLGAARYQALHSGVPSGPVRAIAVAEGEPRLFHGLRRVNDVEHDQTVNDRNTLNQVLPDDGGHAAAIAGYA